MSTHLPQPVRVGEHLGRMIRDDVDRDVLLGCGRTHGLGRARREVDHVDRRERAARSASPRSAPRAADPRRARAAGSCSCRITSRYWRPGRAEARLLVLHHLEEARDRGERRAQLVRHRRDERVAHPVELAVGRHLAQRPHPALEAAGRLRDGARVPAEDAARACDLELVGRGLARLVRELEHALAVALRLGDRVREREQALGNGAVIRHPELADELPKRPVRDEDVPVRVREADAVERRVDQRGLQCGHSAVGSLARAEAQPGERRPDREHEQRARTDADLAPVERRIVGVARHEPERDRERDADRARDDAEVEADERNPRGEGDDAELRRPRERHHRAPRGREAREGDERDDVPAAGERHDASECRHAVSRRRHRGARRRWPRSTQASRDTRRSREAPGPARAGRC